MTPPPSLIDSLGRHIHYVRISVTDRCDLRCVYCMAEDMTFVPRSDVLRIEEIARLSALFVAHGVTKIRLTGGEPLVRKGIVEIAQHLGSLSGLDTLAMTTNGTRLTEFAAPLKQAGVTHLNISLDSLDAKRFHAMTRTGHLDDVLRGIAAAQGAGFRSIKLNTVVLKQRNLPDVLPLIAFAQQQGIDISFIEEMPLGVITDHVRRDEFVSSEQLRAHIETAFELLPIENNSLTSGPSRYWQLNNTSTRVGFISPHSHNFCSSCNRVRLTATGRLLLCLGHENSIDLRAYLRDGARDDEIVNAIRAALHHKPAHHDFSLASDVQVVRFMNTTGG